MPYFQHQTSVSADLGEHFGACTSIQLNQLVVPPLSSLRIDEVRYIVYFSICKVESCILWQYGNWIDWLEVVRHNLLAWK